MFFKLKKNKNQRAFPRKNIIHDAYFIIEDESMKSETIKCWCRNLSEGGIAINSEAKLPEDVSSLKILYRIDSEYRNDKLVIKSKNKDSDFHRYGCQFVDSDKKRDIQINNFLEQNA